VLEGGRRFKDIWVTEPDFQLDLVERGFSGVAGRDAIAGRRVQPALLQRNVALIRARKTGGTAYSAVSEQGKASAAASRSSLARASILPIETFAVAPPVFDLLFVPIQWQPF
jgi:hypothetical protein